MKLLKVLVASTLLVAAANANDVMQTSMEKMDNGIECLYFGTYFYNKENINMSKLLYEKGHVAFAGRKGND